MKNMIPSDFHLSQNYPNPFVGRTSIKFCLPTRARVKIDVFGGEGGLVGQLLDEEKDAGTYQVEFDASGLPDGGYLCILQAGEFVATRIMALKRLHE